MRKMTAEELELKGLNIKDRSDSLPEGFKLEYYIDEDKKPNKIEIRLESTDKQKTASNLHDLIFRQIACHLDRYSELDVNIIKDKSKQPIIDILKHILNEN
jgi:hypothetical protein